MRTNFFLAIVEIGRIKNCCIQNINQKLLEQAVWKMGVPGQQNDVVKGIWEKTKEMGLRMNTLWLKYHSQVSQSSIKVQYHSPVSQSSITVQYKSPVSQSIITVQ